jgi:hypothetical protein
MNGNCAVVAAPPDDQLALRRRRVCTHRASTHKPAHRAVIQGSESTSDGRAAPSCLTVQHDDMANFTSDSWGVDKRTTIAARVRLSTPQ